MFSVYLTQYVLHIVCQQLPILNKASYTISAQWYVPNSDSFTVDIDMSESELDASDMTI